MTLSREETEQPIEGVLMHREPALANPTQKASVPPQPTGKNASANEPAGSTAGNAGTHPAHQVEDLRRQLEGKNELISALVGELEQVVEQLDRVQRSGVNRAPGGAATVGLPASLVDDHQQVLGGLQRVVHEWEELRAASTLGRIESELAELRTLVASGVGRGESHSGHQSVTESVESVLSRLAIGQDAGTAEEIPSALSTMDSARRRLDEEERAESTADDASVLNDHASEFDDVANVLEGIASPEPMDLETATLDELKRACAVRDTYIVRVTRCLRARRAVALPTNWDELVGVPDELRRHVEHLSSRLEEQVRLAEVEISLERARLSRERTELDAEKSVMAKHLKRMGVSSPDDLDDVASSGGSSTDRRWMRFLGVNR